MKNRVNGDTGIRRWVEDDDGGGSGFSVEGCLWMGHGGG